MATTRTDGRYESDLDLFSLEHVMDPHPELDLLRETSPAIYMMRHQFWVLTRYEDVRRASGDWQSYTSAQGVALTPEFNERLTGSVLASDPPEHDALRAVLADKLAPPALKSVRADISTRADQLVDALVGQGAFDAATELGRVFPIDLVADLVGLPQEGRETLHKGADAVFTGFGPMTPMLEERLPALIEYAIFMASVSSRDRLAPESWGSAVMDAVDDGRLTEEGGVRSMSAYLTAGMDTTVNAISGIVWLFAEHPAIWSALRKEPALAKDIVEEFLRWESPLVGFFRVTTRDVDFGDSSIPRGERVLLHWSAGNHDSRHYADPHNFDVSRRPFDHMAFGYGVHSCAGQGLARMELDCLLEALLPRVKSFRMTAPAVRRYNPVVRSWESVPVSVELTDK